MENSCAWYDPSCALAWLGNEIKLILLWILDGILMGFVTVYEAIPVPDFLLNLDPIVVPPGVVWAVDMFQVPVGISIFIAAYLVRFVIRRLPVVG